MNTGQNYTGNDGSAKCNYRTVRSGLTPPPINGNGTTQNGHAPFEPGSINVRVGVVNHAADLGRFDVSQVEVLMNALEAYKKQAAGLVEPNERGAVLAAIDDLEGDIKLAMYDHLSQSATQLYKLQ